MARLKHETADAHARVDACIDLERMSRARYVALLTAFRGAQAAVERELARYAGVLAAYDYDVGARRKVARLDADLAALGADVSLAIDRDFRLDDVGEAFGAIYVVEGSTLGAQVIRRHVVESLALDPARECTFLGGYGAGTGATWKRTAASVTAYAAEHPECDAQLIAGAHQTFALFEHHLTTELSRVD